MATIFEGLLSLYEEGAIDIVDILDLVNTNMRGYSAYDIDCVDFISGRIIDYCCQWANTRRGHWHYSILNSHIKSIYI